MSFIYKIMSIDTRVIAHIYDTANNTYGVVVESHECFGNVSKDVFYESTSLPVGGHVSLTPIEPEIITIIDVMDNCCVDNLHNNIIFPTRNVYKATDDYSQPFIDYYLIDLVLREQPFVNVLFYKGIPLSLADDAGNAIDLNWDMCCYTGGRCFKVGLDNYEFFEYTPSKTLTWRDITEGIYVGLTTNGKIKIVEAALMQKLVLSAIQGSCAITSKGAVPYLIGMNSMSAGMPCDARYAFGALVVNIDEQTTDWYEKVKSTLKQYYDIDNRFVIDMFYRLCNDKRDLNVIHEYLLDANDVLDVYRKTIGLENSDEGWRMTYQSLIFLSKGTTPNDIALYILENHLINYK